MFKQKCKKIATFLVLGLVLSLTAPSSIPTESIKVEAAKKDKKKPKIKFIGSNKLTAKQGEKITIPKTTYSDNKTKKKKLKVAVTVKNGKKQYKSIASKIKKATINNKSVAVTFNAEGTYKITYTVTDAAKNKATKTRTVTVTSKDFVGLSSSPLPATNFALSASVKSIKSFSVFVIYSTFAEVPVAPDHKAPRLVGVAIAFSGTS